MRQPLVMSGDWAEGNAGDKPCVSIECTNCLASLGIPQFHRGVITSTNNPVSIRAEGHAVDVPFECHDELHSRRFMCSSLYDAVKPELMNPPVGMHGAHRNVRCMVIIEPAKILHADDLRNPQN